MDKESTSRTRSRDDMFKLDFKFKPSAYAQSARSNDRRARVDERANVAGTYFKYWCYCCSSHVSKNVAVNIHVEIILRGNVFNYMRMLFSTSVCLLRLP
jgi:hypothetical protein